MDYKQLPFIKLCIAAWEIIKNPVPTNSAINHRKVYRKLMHSYNIYEILYIDTYIHIIELSFVSMGDLFDRI